MKLNELFALPIGLKKIVTFDGIDLYGSDNLNKKVINAVETSSFSKPVSSEITKLINDGMITPVFSSEGIIKFFSRKIGGTDFEFKHFYAFFYPVDNRIYILIDNNINIIGYSNNDELVKLIIHELIHKVSNLKPSYFLTKFKKPLLTFYKELYIELFKLKDSKGLDFLVEDIYTEFYNSTEKTKEVNFKKMLIKFNRLKKYSELPEKDFDKELSTYFNLIKLTLDRQFNLIYTGEFNDTLKIPYFIYKDKFGFFPTHKGCTQELFIPSEVISAIAENNPSDLVYDAIRKITK